MGDIEFPCTMPGCVTVFGSEEELKGHVAEDHLLCPVKAWGRNFLSAKDLGDHLERVHYQCQVPECGQSFSSRKGILDHISKTHVSDSSKLHKCQVEGCGKAYTAVQNLRYHMRTKHPLDGDSKPIKCPQCGDGFTAARQMKYHQGVAHGIWSCTSRDCTLEFETIEELTTHRVVGLTIGLRVLKTDSILGIPWHYFSAFAIYPQVSNRLSLNEFCRGSDRY
jgi:uncharacterized C2H2 Zn-finger protein